METEEPSALPRYIFGKYTVIIGVLATQEEWDLDLREAMNDTVSRTADRAGKLDKFKSAMKQYERASRFKETKEGIKEAAKSQLVKGVAAGAGGAAAGYIAGKMIGKQ